MNCEPVASQDDPRLDDYRQLAEPDRLAARGLFVAESRHVLRCLVAGRRFQLRSVLLTEAALGELGGVLDVLGPDVPVFVAPRSLFSDLAGYSFHRGCLAIAERGASAPIPGLIEAARNPSSTHPAGRIVVLDKVANPDNVGSIFRNARAFGAAGMLLVGGGDPLYRKAVRVSMGATLELPFAVCSEWPKLAEALREAGFIRLAAVVDAEAIPAAELASRFAGRPVALVLGDEGAGISAEVLAHCDARATVPMVPGVDSLNVATASGILLHHLAAIS
ncbi:MAG: RNA methyltransferase [bacterium]|nr:RNA methyltransferase [bacterium]MCP5069906.1 RNA methyltransferase [bacterium]